MTHAGEPQPPTTVQKSEHQTILRVIAVLDRLVARSEHGDGFENAALRQCVEVFRLFADACHHAKEEDLLFKMGDRVLSDDDRMTLCDRFCEVGCRAFGGKKREELEQIADALEQQWST